MVSIYQIIFCLGCVFLWSLWLLSKVTVTVRQQQEVQCISLKVVILTLLGYVLVWMKLKLNTWKLQSVLLTAEKVTQCFKVGY